MLGFLTNALRVGRAAAPRMAGSAKALKLIKPSAVNASPAAVSSLKSVGLPGAASTAATAATKGLTTTKMLGGTLGLLNNPFVGAGLTLGGIYAMDIPYSTRRGILEAGPDAEGNFRPNRFQQVVTGMNADDFKGAYEQQNLKDLMKDPTVRERMSYGLKAPGLGDDIASYLGDTNKAFKAAVESEERSKRQQAGIDEFMSPMSQYLRGERQAQLNREHNMRVRELEAGIELAEDKLDIQRLGLMNQQNQNQYNMELAKYQAGRQADNDRYRTTAGLIKGLSALGSAFVL